MFDNSSCTNNFEKQNFNQITFMLYYDVTYLQHTSKNTKSTSHYCTQRFNVSELI